MRRKGLYLVAVALVLVVAVISVLRHVGLPQPFSGLPFVGPLLTQFIGIRLVDENPEMYRKVEVFRGRGFVSDWRWEYFPGPRGTPHMIPPMVSADLYDAKGRRIATLRRGTGVYVDGLYSNGVPFAVEFYVDGVACGPFASWGYEGEMLSHGFRDREGRLHGRLLSYYQDGAPRAERTYLHGRRVGEHRKWYRDGTIRQVEIFPDSGPFSKIETYDTNGVKYASGIRKGEVSSWSGTFDWWDYVYTNDSWSLWILVYSNGTEIGRHQATNPVPHGCY